MAHNGRPRRGADESLALALASGATADRAKLAAMLTGTGEGDARETP
jgi:hypothetical protein